MPRRDQDFQAIRSEGGLLPADLLRRVIDPRSNLAGTKPEDYGLPVDEYRELVDALRKMGVMSWKHEVIPSIRSIEEV